MLRDLGLPVALRDRQFFRPLGLRGPFTWLDMRATLCLGALDPAEFCRRGAVQPRSPRFE